MLSALPSGFVATRGAMHRVAEEVLKPARERVTGRFGLRALPGGFGTAPFGDVMQVHVVGTELVTRDGTTVTREPIDGVDAGAAAALASWFAFGAGVLEELRAEAGLEHDPTPPQLWPEHFDVAIELGSEARGVRAGYGASPGDELHAEPYLYVVPWSAPVHGELWSAAAFTGGELSYDELLSSGDRRQAALDFFRTRRDDLFTREADR
ncbi:MAG: hypothetical protein QOG42_983 [Solirubrobacteraceae bacterium]|jgi:hypothetical protein|nr:hypothetical protein [Solirubrobacteraceae bacterium]